MYQDIYNCICQNTKNKIYYPLCQTYSATVVCDILYIIAMAEDEYKSEFLSTKHTPHLTITAGLWGDFCEYFDKIDCVISAPHCIYIIYIYMYICIYIMCVKPIVINSRRL